MENDNLEINMDTDVEAGTVTFTVSPAEHAATLALFLAQGMDVLQKMSDAGEENLVPVEDDDAILH